MVKVKWRSYEIVAKAVEKGINYGYHRAHKYADSPDKDAMVQNIEREVMNAICEVIDFENDCVVIEENSN